VRAAGDAISESLDEQHGDKVTDHEVFRRVTPQPISPAL
jgi:hypothetical protein